MTAKKQILSAFITATMLAFARADDSPEIQIGRAHV